MAEDKIAEFLTKTECKNARITVLLNNGCLIIYFLWNQQETLPRNEPMF